MSTHIRKMTDLYTWIRTTNPGNVMNEEESSLPDRLAEAIREWDGRPTWDTDWGPWLDENAEVILCAIEDTEDEYYTEVDR